MPATTTGSSASLEPPLAGPPLPEGAAVADGVGALERAGVAVAPEAGDGAGVDAAVPDGEETAGVADAIVVGDAAGDSLAPAASTVNENVPRSTALSSDVTVVQRTV
jgi:hypothetical protein